METLEEYARAELARTHKSTAGTQAAVDTAVIEPLWEALERDGYVVLPELVEASEVARLRDDLVPRLPEHRGRNNFEGFLTRRLYGVIGSTFSCNAMVEHPLVLALLDRILEPNYLLSQLQAIEILPGEAAQPPHYDDAFYPWPRPRRALGAATIWAIDPFTAENGATRVIPGSHRWGDGQPSTAQLEAMTSIVMPPGSLLFFLGTLWHAAGANRSPDPRLCVTAQYCAPWCRQQENFALSVPHERARACSEHIQRMLGYSIHAPFMGFVNGMHPKRVLTRG
jgi:hypothetical protein